MTFPQDFETRIGFDRIRSLLKMRCLCGLGERQVDAMAFSGDASAVSRRLRLTGEFLSMIRSGESFPDKPFVDPDQWLKHAEADGAVLEAQDLLQLAQGILTVSAWAEYLGRSAERYPLLHELAQHLDAPVKLATEILSRIDDQGRVRDKASPDLYRIRSAISSTETRIRRLASQLLSEYVQSGIIAEGALPAFREGRVVLPVRAEFKRRVRGVILDESATGQTVFMEPEPLLDGNNELRDLQLEEQREVLRILRELTAMVRMEMPRILPAFGFLGELDFIRAKALLAHELDASMPVLVAEPAVRWRSARHPLLQLLLKGKRPLVPLDMELVESEKVLLVSGPNAGGKSVCLKTAGLLQYMLQSGVLPTVHPDSMFGIFQEILLDIGDQQSIENDLSTYSSHLKNMAAFLRHAGNRTLFLIDELGAGTDPAFGGGIAEAVLDRLVSLGAWGLVTTHYANLKTLASRKGGIRNGAMLFDSKKMTPLFRLEVGKPGSSYALELARGSGLPSAVLVTAEQLIGAGLVGLEDLMRRTEEEKVRVEKLRKDLEQQERRFREESGRFEQMSRDLEVRKKEIMARAREDASNLLKQTNREIEKTIRHIRENKAERKETKKIREKLAGLKDQVAGEPTQPKPEAPLKADWKPGDRVRLRGKDYQGTVLSVRGRTAMVQIGLIRSQVSVADLEPGQEGSGESAGNRYAAGIDLASRRMNFTPQQDLRGMRAEEVIPALESFLDDAVLLGIHEVRILHGKGEGVLRKLVREHLFRNAAVASVADEHADRGGAGISVVRLK